MLPLVDLDDEDWLCSFGVNVLEPIITRHGDNTLELVRAMSSSRQFRRALSCVWPSGLSSEGERELAAYTPPEGSLDDIGRHT